MRIRYAVGRPFQPHIKHTTQVMERGYEFFADRQLVTLFSAPSYCAEFDNDAAIMNIDENLQCSFAVWKNSALSQISVISSRLWGSALCIRILFISLFFKGSEVTTT